MGGNILNTYSNVREVYEALKSLDFMAVSDFFMTPTAELADIVLPAATYLEINSLHEGRSGSVVSAIQKVAQVGECWSDCKIFSEMGKRLGKGEYFWDNDEQVLDFILKPAGLTFEELRMVGHISGTKKYRAFEKNAFNTPSEKVELYSKQLEEWGFDPLPVYREFPESPFSEPELAKEYPLVFSSAKCASYTHSSGRQIKSLRESHPDPLITIHKTTAKKLGIREGDWVYIETKRGRIRQKAKLSSTIDPRVVMLEHGWWFPEKKKGMHEWAESNLNVLTGNNPPYARELGSVTLRGILCKVYKSD
jgi:anaerobic selenocysteine-containing dehydrogenase